MTGNLITVLATAVLYTLILYFWKPWLSSYGTEKGKRFARKEDLDQILSEVRAVTEIQKRIESQLSGEEWNRQILWNKRAELYSSVMSVLCELEYSVITQRILESQLRDASEIKLGRDRRLALYLDLRKLVGPMMLFATNAAGDAVSAYFEESTDATTHEEELEALAELNSAVCEEAKVHLHLRESEVKNALRTRRQTDSEGGDASRRG